MFQPQRMLNIRNDAEILFFLLSSRLSERKQSHEDKNHSLRINSPQLARDLRRLTTELKKQLGTDLHY